MPSVVKAWSPDHREIHKALSILDQRRKIMTFCQVVIVSDLQVIQTIVIPVIKEKGEYLSDKKG